jgi:hypothetical protein
MYVGGLENRERHFRATCNDKSRFWRQVLYQTGKTLGLRVVHACGVFVDVVWRCHVVSRFWGFSLSAAKAQPQFHRHIEGPETYLRTVDPLYPD